MVSEKFFERCRGRVTRGHDMKLRKKLVNKDIKKHFYSMIGR